MGATAFLSGCGNRTTVVEDPSVEVENTMTESMVPDMHTTESAVDWNGTYNGVMPCASCEGIDTTVMLNSDNTYTIVSVYKGDADGATFTDTGTLTWSDDGSTVTLSGDDAKMFFVSEGYIQALDANGQKIDGAMEQGYILKKQ